MHPILFRLGSFELGTYGLLVALAFFAGLYLARRQGALDGIPGDGLSDVAVTVLLAGILGSKALMVGVDLIRGASLSEVFSLATLRAAGAVHGGIILGTAAFFWRVRRLKLPLLPTLDAIAPALPLAVAIGRVGCFFAGCCYGSACHQPWAVTFHNLDALRLSGTPLGEPLHPVQLYTFGLELALAGFLVFWRGRRSFPGQVGALLFMLEGVGRIVVETWRGDLDRGVWFGLSWLSTGRLTAGLLFGFGVLVWIWSRRRSVRTVPA